MSEPTVQAPVSLIQTVRAAMDTPNLSWSTRQDIYRRLDALLSQPTPSAEPTRIEDMAPGTTFRARILGQIEDDLWFRTALGVTSATGVRAELWHLDPSTIRDVTPPAHG